MSALGARRVRKVSHATLWGVVYSLERLKAESHRKNAPENLAKSRR